MNNCIKIGAVSEGYIVDITLSERLLETFGLYGSVSLCAMVIAGALTVCLAFAGILAITGSRIGSAASDIGFVLFELSAPSGVIGVISGIVTFVAYLQAL